MRDNAPPVCDYEGSDYQTSFWDQGGRAYEDAVEQIALKRLLPAAGHILLELGAGAGRNTLRYTGYERIVLLDYSLTQLQQAQARLGRASQFIYIAADIYHLPFAPGLFDGATMIRVLHHMADAPLALRQVRACLAEGAPFILEFASKHNLKAILRYLLKRQSWSPFTPEPVEFTALNFDFHPKTVRSWLQGSGFELKRQLTVSHFRLNLLKRWLPLSFLVFLDSLLMQTGDWFQISPSIFTRSQAVGSTPQPPAGAFFRCPVCGSLDLVKNENAITCHQCKRAWPIRDGIYDFRPNAGQESAASSD
jgi:ubiquinone/menaquinone biosynthesis C-methylase UbiE